MRSAFGRKSLTFGSVLRDATRRWDSETVPRRAKDVRHSIPSGARILGSWGVCSGAFAIRHCDPWPVRAEDAHGQVNQTAQEIPKPVGPFGDADEPTGRLPYDPRDL